MKEFFDVAIVGAGPAGIFCALRLKELVPKSRIILLDAGCPIEHRHCPREAIGQCMYCVRCAITHGFSGSGGFSDCKLSLYNQEDEEFVGGELENYTANEELKLAIEQVVKIYNLYGAPSERIGGKIHPIAKEFSEKALKANLDLVTVPFIHTGSTGARKLFFKIEQALIEMGVDFRAHAYVESVQEKDGEVQGLSYTKNGKKYKIKAKNVVLAPGRAGATWLQHLCNKLNIKAQMGPIKVGVRYELSDETMKKANLLYEPKFKMAATDKNDAAITFCHNPSGSVVSESYDGNIVLANGYTDVVKTGNTNLALLFKMNLGSDSLKVAKKWAKIINSDAKGQVMVQRLKDLRNGVKTTEEALASNSVQPTLKEAIPGNLGIVSQRLVENIVLFIDQINQVIPGFGNGDNLLYGLEAKFSNYKVDIDYNFMTTIQGLYAIGDGAGLTNGLIQASTSGWILAEKLTSKILF